MLAVRLAAMIVLALPAGSPLAAQQMPKQEKPKGGWTITCGSVSRVERAGDRTTLCIRPIPSDRTDGRYELYPDTAIYQYQGGALKKAGVKDLAAGAAVWVLGREVTRPANDPVGRALGLTRPDAVDRFRVAGRVLVDREVAREDLWYEAPWLSLRDGAAGVCPSALEVVQVIDGENMLVAYDRSTFWLKGHPTAGVADGVRLRYDGLLAVSGTRQYRTAAGVTRTVFVAEPAAGAKTAELRRRVDQAAANRQKLLERAEKVLLPKPAARALAPGVKPNPAAKAEAAETAAAAKLALCRQLIDLDKREAAQFRLKELIRDYPGTKAAAEAKALLKKL